MKIKAFILCLAMVMLSLSAPAETVTRVIDGDTVILSESGRSRLAGIDAPELKQLGGHESKEALKLLTNKKDIYCLKMNTADRYGRSLCELYVGAYNINELMVIHGWAWDYKEYSHARYEDAMLDAQINHRGIWYEGSNNTPPWKWRRLQRKR